MVVYIFLGMSSNRTLSKTFSSTRNTLRIISLCIPEHHRHDIELYINRCQDDIKEIVLKMMTELNRYSCKLYIDIILNLERTTPSQTDDKQVDHFHISSNGQLYAKSELDAFMDDIRGVIRQSLENHQNELQESRWIIKDIAEFKIHLCQFAKGELGKYSPYPHGLSGSHLIFNPISEENSLLIALASHFYVQKYPAYQPRDIQRYVRYRKEAFWKLRVNIGGLSREEIGWESLYELEELNKVSIHLYNLTSLTKCKTFRLQLVYKSKLNYETVPLLLIKNSHVCYVKNFKSFYAKFSQYREPITDLCLQCLTFFKNSEDYKQHNTDCNLQAVIKPPIIQTLNNDVDNVDEEVSLTEDEDVTRGERSSSNEEAVKRNNGNSNEDFSVEADLRDTSEYNDNNYYNVENDSNYSTDVYTLETLK